MGIVSWPKTERPREKLFHSGPETLSDGESMAVLLRIGKAGQSAEDLGRRLLAKFKSVSIKEKNERNSIHYRTQLVKV